MQLPSNKVGLVLVVVVLVVVSTVFSSKVQVRTQVKDLQNVDLVVSRNTDANYKTGDSDEDGLVDWLEEFYQSDYQNPDTDGDGTKDGEEIEKDRDPTIAGPNDPLITGSDLISTQVGSSTPGTVTDQASIELFSQYLMLKKQGIVKPEDQAKLVDDLSKRVTAEVSLKDKYTSTNLTLTESSKETITIYGDRVAQAAIAFFLEMDSHKNLNNSQYLLKISDVYKKYADTLVQIRVPGVVQDVHLVFANYIYKTGVFFEVLSKSDTDPITSLVVMSQYRATEISEQQLYTTLGQYFKNNDILFDTESTIRFWNNFQK